MIRNFIRTCDLCHKSIPAGQYRQLNTNPEGMDLFLILLENVGHDLELTENPDGTIGADTCIRCYQRICFTHSHTLN